MVVWKQTPLSDSFSLSVHKTFKGLAHVNYALYKVYLAKFCPVRISHCVDLCSPSIGTLPPPPLPRPPPTLSCANCWRKKEIAPIYQCHFSETSTVKIDACL